MPNEKSILDMVGGGIKERVDVAITELIKNIRDPNTVADKPRTLTLKVTLKPDKMRQVTNAEFNVTTTPQPFSPLTSSLYIDHDGTVYEMASQIPGQLNMYGAEQPEPAVLRQLNNNDGGQN